MDSNFLLPVSLCYVTDPAACFTSFQVGLLQAALPALHSLLCTACSWLCAGPGGSGAVALTPPLCCLPDSIAVLPCCAVDRAPGGRLAALLSTAAAQRHTCSACVQ